MSNHYLTNTAQRDVSLARLELSASPAETGSPAVGEKRATTSVPPLARLGVPIGALVALPQRSLRSVRRA